MIQARQRTGNPYARINDGRVGLTNEPVCGCLDIELTERCNNNCIHCCVNLSPDDLNAMSGELTTEEVTGILSEAASLNYLSVRLTGGEPLLREDFSDLYLAARRMGLKVLIFTNATLITPAIADMLACTSPREFVEISVYGMTRESYEGVSRVSGSFRAALGGIQLLLEREVPFIVKGIIVPGNHHEIDSFVSWCRSIRWMDRNPSLTFDFDLRTRRDDEERNAVIRELRATWEDGLKLVHGDMDEYREEMRQFAAKFMRPPGDRLFACQPVGCVDSRGFLNPCMQLKCPTIGYDLRRGSLKEALAYLISEVRELKASNAEYLKRCARCFLKGLCEQCPTKAWLETGALDAPSDYHCEVAHSKARYLGLVGPEENAWEVVNWDSRVREFCGQVGDVPIML